MGAAGTINIDLIARTAAFEAGMKKTEGVIGSFGGALNVVKGLAAGFLAWKGTEFVRRQMEAVDVTAKLADRLGMGTEALTALQHAGDLAGVSSEAMSGSLEKMGKNLAGVSKPTAAITDALGAMGLSFEQMAAKSPDEKLNALADGFQNLDGAGNRAAAAAAIFGKAGLGMVAVLADGSEGLRKAREEADALGLTFSRMDAFKVEQANDALTRVSAIFKGGFTQAAIAVSPVIEAIATSFIDAAKDAGGFGVVTTRVLDAIKVSAGIVGDAWSVLRAGFNATLVSVSLIGEGFARSSDAITHGIQYVSGLWKNWTQLVQDSARVLGVEWESVLAQLRVGLDSFVQFAGGKISELLHTAARAAGTFDAELGASLTSTAYEIGVATGDMAIKAKKNAEEAANAVRVAGEDAKTSWDNLLNIETTGSPMMRDLADGFRESATQAAVDYTAAFNEVLNQDASKTVAEFFAGIEAASAASATAAAERTAVRMQVDMDAAKEEMELAQAKEAWLTGLFQDQATKRLAFEKQTLAQRLDYTAGILGNLATLQNTNSKRLFEIGKIAAYGQAIVTTAAGIARQFADLPIYAAIPAAAAVAVAGAVQIATIAGTSFGGGGSVSSSGGSVPLVNGEPVGVGRGADSNFANTNQRNVQEIRITGLPDDVLLNGRAARGLLQQLIDTARDGGGTLVYNMASA